MKKKEIPNIVAKSSREKFHQAAKRCLEEGIMLPDLVAILINQMEQTAPPENWIYGGIVKEKWVEASSSPWVFANPPMHDDDITHGVFEDSAKK